MESGTLLIVILIAFIIFAFIMVIVKMTSSSSSIEQFEAEKARKNEEEKMNYAAPCVSEIDKEQMKKLQNEIEEREESWSFAQTYYTNGKHLEKTDNINAAIESYEKAIKYEPTFHDVYKRLLVLYRKRKNFENEKRVIRLAIKVFSNEREKRLNRAMKEAPELKDKLIEAFANNETALGREHHRGHYSYSFSRDEITPYEDRLKKLETKIQNKKS